MTDDILPVHHPEESAAPALSTATAGRHRHQWVVWKSDFASGTTCRSCGKPKDEAHSRRGRNNRLRGNAIEREVAAHIPGARRVGQYGGPDDVSSALFVVQVKSGGWYSPREALELAKLPARADQTRLLVKVSTPGSGKGRRDRIVTMTLGDLVKMAGESALVSVSLSPDFLDRWGKAP